MEAEVPVLLTPREIRAIKGIANDFGEVLARGSVLAPEGQIPAYQSAAIKLELALVSAREPGDVTPEAKQTRWPSPADRRAGMAVVDTRPPRDARRSTPSSAPTPSRHAPVGRCTKEQKARVAGKACIVCREYAGHCHPAHVVPRGHVKMSEEAANDVRTACLVVGKLKAGLRIRLEDGRVFVVPAGDVERVA
jgi:hypothetical protein